MSPEIDSLSAIVSAIASIATAIGVAFAAAQIFVQVKQARTTFEDSMAEEYRAIIKGIPVKALLGQDLNQEEYDSALDDLYRYFDLCNEQAFWVQKRRVSRKTWLFWRDGILAHLDRPAFRRAWDHFSSEAPHDFSELRAELSRAGFSIGTDVATPPSMA